MSGLIEEAVNLGSQRRGLSVEEFQHPEHEYNSWAVNSSEVFMSGLVTQENLEALQEIADPGALNVDRRVAFPGVSIVFLHELNS
jgi:hypothetical protein